MLHFLYSQQSLNRMKALAKKLANNREESFSVGTDLYINYGKSNYLHLITSSVPKVKPNSWIVVQLPINRMQLVFYVYASLFPFFRSFLFTHGIKPHSGIFLCRRIHKMTETFADLLILYRCFPFTFITVHQ
jgi:hypothetical protein